MQITQLDEPSPLGLRSRKRPLLLDLIQMRLLEGNSFSSSTKEHKNTAASAATYKLKASNFPASFLKIGTWVVINVFISIPIFLFSPFINTPFDKFIMN